MRRRRFELKNTLSHEFELDLAPLLAVMVKLVPVLLISSAFISVMMVETDLPQVVKDAIVKQEQSKDNTSVQLQISGKTGIQIVIEKSGNQNVDGVPLKRDGGFDYVLLHEKLVNIKKANPEVFRLELAPEGNIAYKEIVKIMDEARRARNNKIVFPVLDSKTGKDVETNYMFPDVVFANILEG